MTAIVAMLRGVNVGPHNRIKMDDLRAICKSLKFANPATYLQSGNVVFASETQDFASVAARLEDAIERKWGFHSAAICRSATEMRQVVKKNPFAARELDFAKLVVLFLNADLSADMRKRLEAIKVGPEELEAQAREIYIYFPEGQGRSKLGPSLDRVLKKSGTARNWNTVMKLTEMAEETET